MEVPAKGIPQWIKRQRPANGLCPFTFSFSSFFPSRKCWHGPQKYGSPVATMRSRREEEGPHTKDSAAERWKEPRFSGVNSGTSLELRTLRLNAWDTHLPVKPLEKGFLLFGAEWYLDSQGWSSKTPMTTCSTYISLSYKTHGNKAQTVRPTGATSFNPQTSEKNPKQFDSLT